MPPIIIIIIIYVMIFRGLSKKKDNYKTALKRDWENDDRLVWISL